MIAFKGGSITRGGNRTGRTSGFVGLAEYLAHGPRNRRTSHRVAAFGSNFGADDIEHAGFQMQLMAESRPTVEKPVYHFGFSLPKDPETKQPLESLTATQWEAVVDRAILELNLEAHQVAWVVHEDAGHQHVHILANRVPLDGGATWRNGRDYAPMERVNQWAEKELGLSVCPNRAPEQRQRIRQSRQTSKEFRAIRSAGRGTFWTDSLPSFREAVSWHDLCLKLGKSGFSIRPATHHAGGLVLRHSSGHHKALSQIHQALSGPRLAGRFGETFAEYQSRNPDPVDVAAAEEKPLTLDRLINRMEAHHAVWNLDDARRAVRAFPNAEEVLAQLQAEGSERLVALDDRTYTTRHMMELETEVFQGAAEQLVGAKRWTVPLSTDDPLTLEHRHAVEHALGREGLAIIQGPAGSGKTRAARAIAESYRAAGYEVLGTSVTGKAAQGLKEATGLDSRTLASWNKSWEHRRQNVANPGKRLMLVDEASMLSLQDMKTLLDEAKASGMKLVLIGDERQLPPVGAGSPYPRLLQDHGAAFLTEIHRQKEEWMREATRALAEGDTAKALESYKEQERIHWTGTLDDARSALVMHWFEDRMKHPEDSSLLMAYRNADVKELNDRIRTLRRQRGELEDGVLVHSKEFASGDRILFRRNDRHSVRNLEGGGAVAVQNGTLGTVLDVAPNRLTVSLDSGTRVEFNPEDYGDVAHGYAVTLHKSQGVTVDRSYMLVDRHVNANGFVTAATRQRTDVQIYVPQDQIKDHASLLESVSRWSKSDLIRDHVPEVSARVRGASWVPKPPEPVLDELKRESVSLFRRLHTSQDLPPSEMASLEDRLQRLRESPYLAKPASDVEAWEGQGESRLMLRRLTERMDVYRYRQVALDALETSAAGMKSEHAAAVERFRMLAPARLVPDPPSVNRSEISRMNLPPEMLEHRVEGIRRLEETLAGYWKGLLLPEPKDPDEWALRADWGRRAESLERRLNRVQWLVKQQASGDWEDFEKLNQDLDRLTRWRPSPRELVESLTRSVDEASSERTKRSTPLEEVLRIHGRLRYQDRLAAKDLELAAEKRTLKGTPRELAAEIQNLENPDLQDQWTASRLGKIYDGDAQTHLKSFKSYRDTEGRDKLLSMLRERPEDLGPLKGFWAKGKTRVNALQSAKNLADDYVTWAKNLAGYKELLAAHESNTRQRQEVLKAQRSLPAREKMLVSLYAESKQLRRSEVALLPESVRRQVETLTREYGGVEAKLMGYGTRLMKGLGHPVGKLSRHGMKRLLSTASPEMYGLVRELNSLVSNAPKYLVMKMLPRPLQKMVRVAKFLQKLIRSQEQDLSKKKDQGLSW